MYAQLIFICPLASGLFDLVGCNLSLSTSIISLKQYIELAIRENDKNAMIEEIQYDKFPKEPLKKRGRKMNKFFVHCNGRSNFRILPIFILFTSRYISYKYMI
jgi:hypothetical protein